MRDDGELELLVKLEALAASAPATRLSGERRELMWDKDDRVRTRAGEVYVIVRHFTADRFGAHVGLASAVCPEDGGERHVYRLPAGTVASEHVGVYVYNPGCWENGALAFDVARAGNTCALVVQPDTCPPVHTIGVADMRGAGTVLLTEKKGGERVRLCFFFEMKK